MRKLRRKLEFDVLNTVEAFTCYCGCPCSCGCICYVDDNKDNDYLDDSSGEDRSSDNYENKLTYMG